MSEFKFPTEVVELPSKGLLYPENHPLRSGKVEMKYMTAKEEDILTNQSYIQNGIMIDKLLQSLIITKFNYDDLLIGDKNAILIAARILGYGKDYEFTYKGEPQVVDLTQLENKPLDENLYSLGINEFPYTLPHTNTEVTFKFLTHGDEKKIQNELKGLKKLGPAVPESSTRLKHIITSVGGNRELKDIREFVDNYLLAKDARELRNYIVKTQPDVDLIFFPTNDEGPSSLPIGPSFLYPDL
jgi:hypothetical protein